MNKEQVKANVDKAIKNLYDYIDSLPDGQREKALAFQNELISKSGLESKNYGEVILKNIKKATSSLDGLFSKVNQKLEDLVDKSMEPKAREMYENYLRANTHEHYEAYSFKWENLPDTVKKEWISKALDADM